MTHIFALIPPQVIFAAVDWVAENLGKTFVESPSIDLPVLFENISSTIPLIFILSTGSDPMNAFLRFARDMNYTERYVFPSTTVPRKPDNFILGYLPCLQTRYLSLG